jgi:CheY-like chemotaxis protein
MARILIVDDNAMNRDLLRLWLQRDKHSIEEASDGDIALRYDLTSFDLVITDIVMSRISGYEVIRSAAAAGITTIAVSGGDRLTGQDPLAAAVELGATLAFRKPFSGPRLLTAVADCLAGVVPTSRVVEYSR